MYRSLLYVPASSEKFVAKAAERGADAIVLDVEDSVAPGQKAAARDALVDSVPRCAANGADVWVRVNRPFRLTVADVEASVRAGARGVLLAKTADPSHVRFVVEIAHDVEREIGRAKPLEIIVMIEDPTAMGLAAAIASADPRVIGVLGGGEDFSTIIDAVPSSETLRLPKLLIHMAAKSVGRFSFGTLGTVADFADQELIRGLATEARRHGFDGATCIHPSLVPILNESYAPPQADIDHARAMIAAFDESVRAGIGAVTFQGKMIDEPVVERARRLLKRVR